MYKSELREPLSSLRASALHQSNEREDRSLFVISRARAMGPEHDAKIEIGKGDMPPPEPVQ
jgi:hypothetical protein